MKFATINLIDVRCTMLTFMDLVHTYEKPAAISLRHQNGRSTGLDPSYSLRRAHVSHAARESETDMQLLGHDRTITGEPSLPALMMRTSEKAYRQVMMLKEWRDHAN